MFCLTMCIWVFAFFSETFNQQNYRCALAESAYYQHRPHTYLWLN